MSYYELPDDDRPPEQIWLDPEELEKHFLRVEEDRKQRYSGTSSVPAAGDEYVEVENEHAAALLRRS